MTEPLTKEARAEIVRYHASHFGDWGLLLEHFKAVCDSHDLMEQQRDQFGLVIDELSAGQKKLIEERDRLLAKMASASVCDCWKSCTLAATVANHTESGIPFNVSCSRCHGTGVQFSDSRAEQIRDARAQEGNNP